MAIETHLDYETLIKKLSIQTPNPACEYYAVTLNKDEGGRLYCSIFSEWVEWADKERRIEIRKASIVRADFVVERRRESGERCLVIDNPNELDVFLLTGGHAVIEKHLAKSQLSKWLEPEQVVAEGATGFTAVNDLNRDYKSKAPSRRLRMEVIKRDGHACRICGRRPGDNPDIELHVHHIKPRGVGGVTTARNLITLCQTCHGGLYPHYDRSLHHILEPRDATYSRSIDQYNSNLFTRELRSK